MNEISISENEVMSANEQLLADQLHQIWHVIRTGSRFCVAIDLTEFTSISERTIEILFELDKVLHESGTQLIICASDELAEKLYDQHPSAKQFRYTHDLSEAAH